MSGQADDYEVNSGSRAGQGLLCSPLITYGLVTAFRDTGSIPVREGNKAAADLCPLLLPSQMLLVDRHL